MNKQSGVEYYNGMVLFATVCIKDVKLLVEFLISS